VTGVQTCALPIFVSFIHVVYDVKIYAYIAQY
jgi:hypothetical protein